METELKYCPHCEEWLPRSEFGICRSRKDGQNLYCRKSIKIKVDAFRQRRREYRAAHGVAPKKQAAAIPKFSPQRIARMLRKLSPADRVREAVRCGAHTQKEIATLTKLSVDTVCDSIAEMLLWTRQIRTKVVKGQRMYFIVETDELVARKPMAMSYSAVKELMPGRKVA